MKNLPVKAGEVWNGVGTLASPIVGWCNAPGGTGRGRRKRPHPSSLPLPPLRLAGSKKLTQGYAIYRTPVYFSFYTTVTL